MAMLEVRKTAVFDAWLNGLADRKTKVVARRLSSKPRSLSRRGRRRPATHEFYFLAAPNKKAWMLRLREA
jgi:hypothetical protein